MGDPTNSQTQAPVQNASEVDILRQQRDDARQKWVEAETRVVKLQNDVSQMEYRLKESDAMRAEIAQLRAELCGCRVQSVRANVLEMQLQDLKWELARKTELQYRPDGASNAVTTLEGNPSLRQDSGGTQSSSHEEIVPSQSHRRKASDSDLTSPRSTKRHKSLTTEQNGAAKESSRPALPEAAAEDLLG